MLRLEAGSVVGYVSESRGLVRAIVKRGPYADGTWDLDVKPHAPASRIRPASELSQAQGVAPQAHGVGPSVPNSHTPATLGHTWNQDNGHNTATRPPGSICFYKSASKGWIPARVKSFRDFHYDLDCKDRAFPEAIFWIDAGSLVEYWSSSQNRWIPSRVVRQGRQPGTFDLDCREGAQVQHMRPCNRAVEEPPTLEAIPGMACYDAGNGNEQKEPVVVPERRDQDMIYENHKVDMRIRPRSSSRERRPQSVEELENEDDMRRQLNEAVASRNLQQLQAAIKHANAMGMTTGPELSSAIKCLQHLGGRLERTSSCDAMRSPPDTGAFGGSFGGGRTQSKELPKQTSFVIGPDGNPDTQWQSQPMQGQRRHSREGLGQNHEDHEGDPHSQAGAIVQPNKKYSEGLLTKMIGPKPTEGAGVLTRMLGPSPTEDAGLLTRILGPKPNEDSGILERFFGPDHGILGAEAEEELGTAHEFRQPSHQGWGPASIEDVGTQPLCHGQVYQPPQAQSMSGAFASQTQRQDWQPPQSQQMGGAFGSQATPGTDPQLHHLNPSAPRPGYDISSGSSAPPTNPQLRQQSASGYGINAGPAGDRSNQPAYGAPGYGAYSSQAPYGGMTGAAPPTNQQLYQQHQAPYDNHGSYLQNNAMQPPPADIHLPFMSGQAPPTDPQMGGPRPRIS